MPLPRVTDAKSLTHFTVYAILLGLFAALTLEVIKGPEPAWHPWLWWAANLAIIVVIVIVYSPGFSRWLKQSTSPQELKLSSSEHVRPARGLVLLVSRKEFVRSGEYAVDYHRRVLEHLWLVHSADLGSVNCAAEIEKRCRAVAPTVEVHKELLGNVFVIEITKTLIEAIRNQAHRLGIEDQDFICDFTGMNKPVSAGVVLACVQREHRLQYMEPNRVREDGSPDQEAGSHPIEVDISYEIERA
jgi:hypothetical protein